MTSLMSSPFSAMSPFCAAQSYAPLTASAKWSTANPLAVSENSRTQQSELENEKWITAQLERNSETTIWAKFPNLPHRKILAINNWNVPSFKKQSAFNSILEIERKKNLKVALTQFFFYFLYDC
jgi:hypothetical protein